MATCRAHQPPPAVAAPSDNGESTQDEVKEYRHEGELDYIDITDIKNELIIEAETTKVTPTPVSPNTCMYDMVPPIYMYPASTFRYKSPLPGLWVVYMYYYYYYELSLFYWLFLLTKIMTYVRIQY